MNIMTKMETIVMNMTGCNRQTANLVVNAIIDEWDGEDDVKNTKYRIYHKTISSGIVKPTKYVFDSVFDASQKCNWLNENAVGGVFGRYFYKEDEE